MVPVVNLDTFPVSHYVTKEEILLLLTLMNSKKLILVRNISAGLDKSIMPLSNLAVLIVFNKITY